MDFSIKLRLCPLGVRKDHSRVLRHGKRRIGNSDRVKAPKDLEHRTATPQDGRKHGSSSGAGGGRRKSSDTGMPPDQVLIVLEILTFKILCCRADLANCMNKVGSKNGPRLLSGSLVVINNHIRFNGNVANGCLDMFVVASHPFEA